MIYYLILLEDREDKAAFQALYEANARLMWHMAGRFLKDQDLRMDAVQDAWAAAAKNYKKIMTLPCEKQGAYLVIIVKNCCRNILARERKYTRLPEDPAELEAALGGAEDQNIEGAGADARRALELLRDLPEPYRAVLEARLVLGLGNGETARALGVTDGKAGTWFARGRALLAKKLREEGICCE